MSDLARASAAASSKLEQPAAPFDIRALYENITAAPTLMRKAELGEHTWERRVDARLERLELPGVVEVPRVRKENLTPAVVREATQCPTPDVFEGLVAESEAVRSWSPS